MDLRRIGTASRVISRKFGGYRGGPGSINYGIRSQLKIAGVPVGRELADTLQNIFNGIVNNSHMEHPELERGSIIVIVATDAPLLPHQLKRIAQRVPLGIGRVGGIGGNGSGDIFLAFSTSNKNAFNRSAETAVKMYPNDQMGLLFDATIQAVEEAITNALFAAKTMTGINGNTIYALPKEAVVALLKKYRRIP
jgi:L-aminopeptidase/D-esterase-like protein